MHWGIEGHGPHKFWVFGGQCSSLMDFIELSGILL